MNKLLHDALHHVIQQMPNDFESHDVINKLNEEHHELYLGLRNQYKGGECTANAMIALTLGRNARDFGIVLTGEIKNSLNVNGNETPNHCWRKEEL